MIELLLALLLGILMGTFTGLLPGLHINLVSPIIISVSAYLTFVSPLFLVVFIVSLSITHTFLDFIPSIFLGAPNEDTALSVLPGHSLLLEGKGHEAVLYSIYGCLLGALIFIIFIPLFIFILPSLYAYFKSAMFFILIFASVYLVSREKSIYPIVIFMLAGFLGLATIKLPLKNSLLPLLTGLFGSSALLISLTKKQTLPTQKVTKIKINKNEIKNSFLASVLSAPLCSFLPALGSSQAAVIGSDITGESNKKEFLMLLGMIAVSVMALSFIALYALEETRTGSAVFVKEIIGKIDIKTLLIIITTIIFSSLLSFFIAIKLSKFFAKNISRVNYNKLSVLTLIFISLIVFIFSSSLGFFVFLVATFTGLTAILLNVRRANLMAALMLPAILFYFPF